MLLPCRIWVQMRPRCRISAKPWAQPPVLPHHPPPTLNTHPPPTELLIGRSHAPFRDHSGPDHHFCSQRRRDWRDYVTGVDQNNLGESRPCVFVAAARSPSSSIRPSLTKRTRNRFTNHPNKVSPVTPIATSEGRVLLVKLLGDLSGYTQLPVLRSDRPASSACSACSVILALGLTGELTSATRTRTRTNPLSHLNPQPTSPSTPQRKGPFHPSWGLCVCRQLDAAGQGAHLIHGDRVRQGELFVAFYRLSAATGGRDRALACLRACVRACVRACRVTPCRTTQTKHLSPAHPPAPRSARASPHSATSPTAAPARPAAASKDS
jgi:hypothetical protein